MTEHIAAAGSNPFWTFSLKIYASAEVQKACLDLQDGSGVDVNVLLYMLWLGARGRRLSVADARMVLDAVEDWRAGVVVPLRTARRNLKSPPVAIEAKGAESLRNMVKKLELEAERLQQSALHALQLPASMGQPEADRAAAARANVAAYGQALSRQLAPGPVDVMLTALAALVAKGEPI